VTYVDQLRADAYRWLLTIAETHHLPVPSRIEAFQYSLGWHLQLHLDDDQGDQVRRWADVLHLPMGEDLPVIGDRRRWTCVSASGPADDIVFTGWDTIRVDSYCDFTAIGTADTTMTTAAA
jgi:hypothetical protein